MAKNIQKRRVERWLGIEIRDFLEVFRRWRVRVVLGGIYVAPYILRVIDKHIKIFLIYQLFTNREVPLIQAECYGV